MVGADGRKGVRFSLALLYALSERIEGMHKYVITCSNNVDTPIVEYFANTAQLEQAFDNAIDTFYRAEDACPFHHEVWRECDWDSAAHRRTPIRKHPKNPVHTSTCDLVTNKGFACTCNPTYGW